MSDTDEDGKAENGEGGSSPEADGDDKQDSGKYDRDDAAAEHGEPIKEVTRAWHDARDDSGVRSGDDKQHFEKAPDDSPQETDSGIPLYPASKK